MSDSLKKSLLEKYVHIHTYKDFDTSCLEDSNVSNRFADVFKEGPEKLFDSLREFQPLTYSALLSCQDLWLLERSRAGQKGSAFTLAIVFNDHLITSQMINKRLIHYTEKSGESLNDCMNFLNKEFYGYYYCFNGLNNPKSKSPAGLRNYDLPSALGHWDEIIEFCKEYNIPKKMFSKVLNATSNRLLVWIANDNGELFLIEESSSDMSIYRVNYKESDNFIKLANPVNEIDTYCSQVILGQNSRE